MLTKCYDSLTDKSPAPTVEADEAAVMQRSKAEPPSIPALLIGFKSEAA
jgi:hypothetical protein